MKNNTQLLTRSIKLCCDKKNTYPVSIVEVSWDSDLRQLPPDGVHDQIRCELLVHHFEELETVLRVVAQTCVHHGRVDCREFDLREIKS